MENQIKINGKEVSYKVKKSNRAKRMSLAVYRNGSIVVTQPKNITINNIESFLLQKINWLSDRLTFFNGLKKTIPTATHEDYLLNKQAALDLVTEKIEEINKYYKFRFNKVSIKNQKTRWGSCSLKRNLNFNYRIIYLPESISNYIIAHELCHLKEMNHSQRFWDLISQSTPNYVDIKKELKNIL